MSITVPGGTHSASGSGRPRPLSDLFDVVPRRGGAAAFGLPVDGDDRQPLCVDRGPVGGYRLHLFGVPVREEDLVVVVSGQGRAVLEQALDVARHARQGAAGDQFGKGVELGGGVEVLFEEVEAEAVPADQHLPHFFAAGRDRLRLGEAAFLWGQFSRRVQGVLGAFGRRAGRARFVCGLAVLLAEGQRPQFFLGRLERRRCSARPAAAVR